MRRLGITSDYHAHVAANHARHNIRGGPTAGLHYEQSNAPGVFFPYHKTEVVGDKAHAPIRYPCLNDPAYQGQMTAKIEQDISNQVCYAPQSYSLAHEWNYRAYGSLSGPLDTCFCTNCQVGFRQYLRSEYGTLERLNKVWGSAFSDWDSVGALVLADAVAAGQIPRWIDHRRYADQIFADFFKLKLAALRKLDPAAEGGGINLRMSLTTLDSYSGVDFWKLYREAGIFSYLENPYVLAFTPPDSPRRRLLAELKAMWHPNCFAADPRLHQLRAGNLPWQALLEGARGFGYYEEYFFMPPYSPFQPILNADLTASQTIRNIAGAVDRIRAGLGHFLFDGRMADSHIALLYSRASEHAATAWQAINTNALASRLSPPERMGFYTKGLPALGYQFTALSDDQLAQGALDTAGIQLLILPFTQALSTGAVEQLRSCAVRTSSWRVPCHA